MSASTHARASRFGGPNCARNDRTANNSTIALLALIQPFVSICLLRGRPQDLPASGLLLAVALTGYVGSTLLAHSVVLEISQPVLSTLVDTVLSSALPALLLYAHRLRQRIIQTLTALVGTGTIVTMIALPFVSELYEVARDGAEPGIEGPIVVLLWIWHVAVIGHILRHALSSSYLVGVLIGIALYVISSQVLGTLFVGELVGQT